MNKNTYTLAERFREMRRSQGGFTLLDVMIGIVVMGLISAAACTAIFGLSGKNTTAKKPTSTPSPITDPAPVTSSAPAEFPWAIVLGIGVSAILVVAFIALTVWFIRKNNAAMVVSKNNVAGWEKLITRHRELRMKWASYELDMAKLIDFPVMTDMKEPTTAVLHKALKNAADLEPANAKSMSSRPVANSDFWNAVNDLDTAFHTAEQTAKKVAWSRFTAEERKSLATAKNLLALALDTGASPAERQAAYKRVFKELQGLIEFPEKARLEIEARHQLALVA